MTICPRKMYPRTKILGRRVPWTMRPLDDASPGRRVPWTMRPLDDVSPGRCVPWPMLPLDDASLWMRPLDYASLTDVSRPWAADRRWVIQPTRRKLDYPVT
jgi:hypothetical protein